MISKGPDSLGVVDLAQNIGASCVRGNHEDRVLLVYAELNAKRVPLPGPEEPIMLENDEMEEESFSHGDYRDRALAKMLSHDQASWLMQCPVILKVGNVKGMDEVVVVHGGLVPGIALEKQDPFSVMNMRTIDLNTHVPNGSSDGVNWTKVFCYHSNFVRTSY
jgi:hypothetical protein